MNKTIIESGALPPNPHQGRTSPWTLYMIILRFWENRRMILAYKRARSFELGYSKYSLGFKISTIFLISIYILITHSVSAISPRIEFTHVPPYDSYDDLTGRVYEVNPDDYRIAVYICVASNWWTKPNSLQPLTTIQPDGSWSCDVTTGGNDHLAEKISAFLILKEYTPPSALGILSLPEDLFQNAASLVEKNRAPSYRAVSFCGIPWNVKVCSERCGPGNNIFSDADDAVFVDSQGTLHLRIAQEQEAWYSTEVVCDRSFPYGLYLFQIASPVHLIDKNIVAGLFTWDNGTPEHNYREIDMELSRWGEEENQNSQYVIQPYHTEGNMERFDITTGSLNLTTHLISWKKDEIEFRSWQGVPDEMTSNENLIYSWKYEGEDIPSDGAENPRINFWLMNSQTPSDLKEAELLVRRFDYFDPLTSPTQTQLMNFLMGRIPRPPHSDINQDFQTDIADLIALISISEE